LPRFPRRVGIVTSLQAAALRDVLTTLQRRAPYLHAIVYPVPVQGAGAGAGIAAMLERVSSRGEVDVVLLVRGGGSIEDLWAFNEEVVARAIRASALPVVVGVGHESDVTIADFAADLRAATPTAAAELVAPDVDSLRDAVAARLQRLGQRHRARLQGAAQRLDYALRGLATPRAPFASLDSRLAATRARLAAAAARALADGSARLSAQRTRWWRSRPLAGSARLTELRHRLGLLASGAVQARALRLHPLAARLVSLDPLAVLRRGYAIALDESGKAVTQANALELGASLRLVLAAGAAGVRVESVDAAGRADLSDGPAGSTDSPTAP
jgi:exodeoxyribonuclease VII large subunit